MGKRKVQSMTSNLETSSASALLEQQVATLCGAVSTLVDKGPEEATVPTCIRGQASFSGRSNSFEGDSFDGNAMLDPLTATAVFANVALDEVVVDELQQLCTVTNCELDETGSTMTEIPENSKLC